LAIALSSLDYFFFFYNVYVCLPADRCPGISATLLAPPDRNDINFKLPGFNNL